MYQDNKNKEVKEKEVKESETKNEKREEASSIYAKRKGTSGN